MTITTAREYALKLLSESEARTYTGRCPRLLSDFEQNFLIEDVKVGGLQPKRLREMLRFFYRSWTELRDEDPNWLVDGEEKHTYKLVRGSLSFMQGMLEPELSALAFRYLRDCKQAQIPHAIEHVFVDDYQNISRASQALLNTLATRSLTIAGHKNECTEVLDSFPYAAGLDEFCEANPHAQRTQLTTCYLPRAITQAAQGLLADPSMNDEPIPAISTHAPAGKVTVLDYPSFLEEFEGIADQVAATLGQGMKASDVFIVTPNRIWDKYLEKNLGERGISTQTFPKRQVLNGNICDYERSTLMRIYSALMLVADRRDGVAWRSWCGYGDYLTNSVAFCKLKDFAEERNLGLAQALECINEDPSLVTGIERVQEAYRKGVELLGRVEGLRGNELLDELSVQVTEGRTPSAPPLIQSLCESCKKDTSSAQQLAATAARNLTSPRFKQADQSVRLGSAKNLCGLSPKLLVYSGFVNGFIPSGDYFDTTKTPPDTQKKIHARDVRLLYTAVSKARGELILSYFTKTDLESAETLKLDFQRIRLEDGVKMCGIAPSELMALMLPRRG